MPNKRKSSAPENLIKKELNSLYEKFYSIKNFRKRINKSYDEALDNNRILRLMLQLLVTCTFGIYILIIMFAFYWRYNI